MFCQTIPLRRLGIFPFLINCFSVFSFNSNNSIKQGKFWVDFPLTWHFRQLIGFSAYIHINMYICKKYENWKLFCCGKWGSLFSDKLVVVGKGFFSSLFRISLDDLENKKTWITGIDNLITFSSLKFKFIENLIKFDRFLVVCRKPWLSCLKKAIMKKWKRVF